MRKVENNKKITQNVENQDFCIIYCITRIFRVEEIFAIFANLDCARNFPPAK